MNNNPKVSIIVPVYKAEQFIHRCIDSILFQNYTNFECLLIDDGSPDKSGDICDQYAQKDSRIKTIHKDNGGVSSARNLGLSIANGDWICFLDSDDYWDSASFLNMIEQIKDDVDIVHFGYSKECKDGSLRKFFDFREKKMICRDEFFKSGIFSSCYVSYFFSKRHLQNNNLKFTQTIKYSEDREFIIKSVLYSTKQILLLPNCDYIYTLNLNSATNTKREYKHCKDDLQILKNIYSIIEKDNIPINQTTNDFISYLIIDSFILSVCTVCKDGINYTALAKKDLQSVCNAFPLVNNGFTRYKFFIRFPFFMYLYYNLRVGLRRFIKKN